MEKHCLYAPAYFWHSLHGKTPDFETYLEGFSTLKNELGIQAAELAAFSFAWDDQYASNQDRIKSLLQTLGVTLCNYRIMTPDVVALNDAVRAGALVRAEKAFQNAAAFGITSVQVDTLSPIQIYAYDKGIAPDLENVPEDFDPLAIRQVVKESLAKLAEYAETYNVDLLIEPRSLGVISTPESAAIMIHDIGSDRIKVVFDTAHMTGQNVPLSISWGILQKYVNKVHLADNRPQDMRHGPIGSCATNFTPLLQALGKMEQKIYVAIELLTFPAECIVAYRESIKRLKQTMQKIGAPDLIELPEVESP